MLEAGEKGSIMATQVEKGFFGGCVAVEVFFFQNPYTDELEWGTWGWGVGCVCSVCGLLGGFTPLLSFTRVVHGDDVHVMCDCV